MRIAFVTETFLPSIDGITTRLQATIHHLLAAGHTVAVAAPAGSVSTCGAAQVFPIPGIPYWFYPERRFCLPAFGLKDFLADFRPDIVHVVNPVALGLAGIYHARRMRLPLVASFHTNLAAYAQLYRVPFLSPVSWFVLRHAHNRAQLNLATSAAMVAELSARRFRNVALWPRGVDAARFSVAAPSAGMRDRLTGGRPRRTALLYVGRLAPEKRLDTLRPLMDSLPDDLSIAFVGDGPERSRLEASFSGTAAVFTGYLQGDELCAAYASADAFIFPSTTETLGLVLLEAMAAGLPIIAARSKPTIELLGEDSSLLFDAGSAASLQDSVRTLRENADAERQRAAQRRAAAADLDWRDASERLLDYYTQVLTQSAHAKSARRKSFSRRLGQP